MNTEMNEFFWFLLAIFGFLFFKAGFAPAPITPPDFSPAEKTEQLLDL